jgi:NADPH:quinone reductase-like Zn-dependent oxidoreductase
LGATVTDPEEFWAAGSFDVILELIGGPNLDADVKALDVGGRIVVIGVGGGAKGQVNLLALMGVRGSIHASTLRARPLEGKAVAARAVDVRPTAARRYDDRIQHDLQRTAFAADCHSWYKTESGRITNNWPGPTLRYWLDTRRFRRDDLIIDRA